MGCLPVVDGNMSAKTLTEVHLLLPKRVPQHCESQLPTTHTHTHRAFEL